MRYVIVIRITDHVAFSRELIYHLRNALLVITHNKVQQRKRQQQQKYIDACHTLDHLPETQSGNFPYFLIRRCKICTHLAGSCDILNHPIRILTIVYWKNITTPQKHGPTEKSHIKYIYCNSLPLLISFKGKQFVSPIAADQVYLCNDLTVCITIWYYCTRNNLGRVYWRG